MWLTVGVVAAVCFALLGVWIVWSLMRSAASDSSGVAEEYADYVRRRSEDAAKESCSETHASTDQWPT